MSFLDKSREKPGRAPYRENRILSFVVDRNLQVSQWERDISDFTGRSSTEAIGRKYFEILPRIMKDDRDAVKMVLEGKGDLEIEGYVAACFSSSVRTGAVVKALHDGDGGVSGAHVVFSPQSLCPVEKRLRSSQWLIDMGKMTTTLAHGVRNPLNAIKGAVTFLGERYAGDGVLTEFTRIIEEEVSRLDQFISTFLSTSLSDIELAETDINAMMRKVEVSAALHSEASGIEIAFDYGDLPLVRTSEFHLEQAVMNVVSNAIEAMPGAGRLSVRTELSARPDGDYILIQVSDNGPGMSGDGGEPSQGPGGKGYGLFITREVLSSLGGDMEIDSRKGEGTVVSLYIAVDRRSQAMADDHRAGERASAGGA
ncbi:nitrogen regulation protein NR(II) [Candidatus Moduliflexota bacterium]